MKNPHPILVFNVASFGTVLHCVAPHNEDSNLRLLSLAYQSLEIK